MSLFVRKNLKNAKIRVMNESIVDGNCLLCVELFQKIRLLE